MVFIAEVDFIGAKYPNCFTLICITVILLLYAHCKRPCGPYVANKCM